MNKARVAVLASGSGSNLAALIRAAEADDFPATIVVVVSDKRDAFALERARSAGIPAEWVSRRGRASRRDFDQALVDVMSDHRVDWVVLAGFMRLLTTTFLDAYSDRVINIHPTLLPAFPGMNGQQQAFEYGVKIAGATVHFVDSGTDTGVIIDQISVPVHDDDTLESLKARILTAEHTLYPRALAAVVSGKIRPLGRKVQSGN